MSLISPGPELTESERILLAGIERDTRNAMIFASVGLILCCLLVFQIVALVLAIGALRRIEQTGLGAEYRMRAVVAILIAVLGLLILLAIILVQMNPESRMTIPIGFLA